jgi:flagellar basal-body rod modification protein FlgD
MTPAIASTTPTSSTAPATSSTSGTSASSNATVNEDSFLQLLVAELENQDPSNPTDGTQFVTQLAEFQQVTTTMNMATSVTGIEDDTNQLVTIAGGTPSNASQSSSSGTANNSQTDTQGTSGTQS